MAIEGPLRELGIHDVFQLLDLSRKTGVLRVSSALRDNEGTVYFERGKLVAAQIRSNPYPLGAMLLRAGKIGEAELAAARARQTEQGDRRRIGEILVSQGALTAKELERQVRLQVEAVVFELMSWREGFFRFEEQPLAESVDTSLAISTESVLMEAARRIDEWSRIADRVPSIDVVPRLAPVDDEHQTQLDLLPTEWEVLALIDGERDLRSLAVTLSRSEFDVAKVVYGLVVTGVLELEVPRPAPRASSSVTVAPMEPETLWHAGRDAARRGALGEAARAWRQFLSMHPQHAAVDKVRAGLEAVLALDSVLGGDDGRLA